MMGAFAAKDVDPNLCTHILYAFVGLNIFHDWDLSALGTINKLYQRKFIKLFYRGNGPFSKSKKRKPKIENIT